MITALNTALKMTARAAVAAVLLLVVLAACLWAKFGPQGAWTLAWIVVVFAVVSCAVPAWIALQPKGGDSGTGRPVPGLACPGCGSPDVDLRRGLLCGTCAEAAAAEGGGDHAGTS